MSLGENRTEELVIIGDHVREQHYKLPLSTYMIT